jgi:hypothetical protein
MEPTDTITITNLSELIDGYETDKHSNTVIGGGYASPSISISSPNVFSLGNTTSPYNSVSATGGLYTITSGAGTGSLNPWGTTGAKIRLDGEDADIEVNGWSLIDSIKRIEERLNILHPNTKLETEWVELRELGEQYRKLEQHIRDKQATWDRLKAMPRPVVE